MYAGSSNANACCACDSYQKKKEATPRARSPHVFQIVYRLRVAYGKTSRRGGRVLRRSASIVARQTIVIGTAVGKQPSGLARPRIKFPHPGRVPLRLAPLYSNALTVAVRRHPTPKAVRRLSRKLRLDKRRKLRKAARPRSVATRQQSARHVHSVHRESYGTSAAFAYSTSPRPKRRLD